MYEKYREFNDSASTEFKESKINFCYASAVEMKKVPYYIYNYNLEHFTIRRQIKLIENIKKLERFSKFKKNWNDNNAEPIDLLLIDICEMILCDLAFQPKIFPTARNSIQFEYEKEDGNYIEFEIFNDKINFLRYNISEEISKKENILDTEMIDIINTFHAN